MRLNSKINSQKLCNIKVAQVVPQFVFNWEKNYSLGLHNRTDIEKPNFIM